MRMILINRLDVQSFKLQLWESKLRLEQGGMGVLPSSAFHLLNFSEKF
jgi:hypothetical protein